MIGDSVGGLLSLKTITTLLVNHLRIPFGNPLSPN